LQNGFILTVNVEKTPTSLRTGLLINEINKIGLTQQIYKIIPTYLERVKN